MSEFLSLAFSLLLFGLFNVANSVNVITVSQEKDWQISNKYLNNDTLLMAQVVSFVLIVDSSFVKFSH